MRESNQQLISYTRIGKETPDFINIELSRAVHSLLETPIRYEDQDMKAVPPVLSVSSGALKPLDMNDERTLWEHG